MAWCGRDTTFSFARAYNRYGIDYCCRYVSINRYHITAIKSRIALPVWGDKIIAWKWCGMIICSTARVKAETTTDKNKEGSTPQSNCKAWTCRLLAVALLFYMHWYIYIYFFFAHFHFPASGQAVVAGFIPSPPRFLPSTFIAHRAQQSHCSSIVHRVLLTHALALSASQFVHKKKSRRIYTSMHSAGLELTKLTCTRLEDNLIRHRGDMYIARGLVGFGLLCWRVHTGCSLAWRRRQQRKRPYFKTCIHTPGT